MFYLPIAAVSLLVFSLTKKIIDNEIKYRNEIRKESDSIKKREFFQARKRWFSVRFIFVVFILLPVLSVVLLMLIKVIL